MTRRPIVLTIAASDPSGGAGLQMDLQVLAAHGVFGMAVPTALTFQHARAMRGVEPVAPSSVAASIATLFAGEPPDAIKVGALGDEAVGLAALAALQDAFSAHGPRPVVLDPVLRATAGGTLGTVAGVRAWMRARLVRVLTPNLEEWRTLVGDPGTSLSAGVATLGVDAVLLKGGHAEGDTAVDRLHHAGAERTWSRPRRPKEVHGTGCALASAIAARLAHGADVDRAVEEAEDWMDEALASAERHGEGWVLGLPRR